MLAMEMMWRERVQRFQQRVQKAPIQQFSNKNFQKEV